MGLLCRIKINAFDLPHHAGGSIHWNSSSEGQLHKCTSNSIWNLNSIDSQILFKEFVQKGLSENASRVYSFIVRLFIMSKTGDNIHFLIKYYGIMRSILSIIKWLSRDFWNMKILYESIFLNEKQVTEWHVVMTSLAARARYFYKIRFISFTKISLLMCTYENLEKIYTKMLIAVITGW